METQTLSCDGHFLLLSSPSPFTAVSTPTFPNTTGSEKLNACKCCNSTFSPLSRCNRVRRCARRKCMFLAGRVHFPDRHVQNLKRHQPPGRFCGPLISRIRESCSDRGETGSFAVAVADASAGGGAPAAAEALSTAPLCASPPPCSGCVPRGLTRGPVLLLTAPSPPPAPAPWLALALPLPPPAGGEGRPRRGLRRRLPLPSTASLDA